MKMNHTRGIGMAVLLSLGLSACAPVMIAGFAGTALVASDRRTSGAQLEDETIELRGSARVRDALGERAHVNITSYNRQVLISGEVANERDKQIVEGLLEKLENVKTVVNELAIMPPSALSSRSNDLLTTAKVKAA